jgi:hypothetical protein
MKVYQRHKDVIHLRGGTFRGAVKLTYDGEQKTWLLTAYDSATQKKGEIGSAPGGTPASPSAIAEGTNPATPSSAPDQCKYNYRAIA